MSATDNFMLLADKGGMRAAPKTSGYKFIERGYGSDYVIEDHSLDNVLFTMLFRLVNNCGDGMRRAQALRDAIDELMAAQGKMMLKLP